MHTRKLQRRCAHGVHNLVTSLRLIGLEMVIGLRRRCQMRAIVMDLRFAESACALYRQQPLPQLRILGVCVVV